MKEIKDFSQKYGNDIINFQGTGGNISIKKDDFLYIKASGYKIYDIYEKDTLSKISISGFFNSIQSCNVSGEEELSMIFQKNNRSSFIPSIETGFHLLLDNYVIHAHNTYINVLLCMEGGEEILNKLFGNEFTFINYYSPGIDLFNAIRNKSNLKGIIFLKNHGIILHGNKSFIDLNEKLNSIQNIIIKELKLNEFIKTNSLKFIRKHIFPDTIVIQDGDVYSSHNYIKNQIKKIGGIIQFLSKSEVDSIKNMNQEKYRQKLFHKNYVG